MEELASKIEKLIVEAETDSDKRYSVTINDESGNWTYVGRYRNRMIEKIEPHVNIIDSYLKKDKDLLDKAADELAKLANLSYNELWRYLKDHSERLVGEHKLKIATGDPNKIAIQGGISMPRIRAEIAKIYYAPLKPKDGN